MLLLLLFYYKCQAKKSVAYALTEMRAMILCSTVYKVFESDHKVTLTTSYSCAKLTCYWTFWPFVISSEPVES